MNEYIIRELNENDYEEYLKLINEFRQTYFTKNKFIEILNKIRNNSNIWVIEKDNKLISSGTIIYENKFIHNVSKIAHLEDIIVSKEYRGFGYGEKLISYLIEESKKNKCYKVILDCDESLEKFYKKNNFKKNNIGMSIYF
jgi:glucosamine-phosphate N-acetyltransferase